MDIIPDDEEILAAIRSCDPSIAPGYDGYNLKFLLRMWDIVGEEILSFVKLPSALVASHLASV